MIDLTDYYSGGYFLIRTDKPGGIQLQTGQSQGKLLSLSGCICPRVEVAWGWIPGDSEAALQFGIPESKLNEFVEWCGTAHHIEIDFLSMFHSVDAARHFIERFLPDTTDLYLIGAGLHRELAALDWYEEKVAPTDVPRPPPAEGIGWQVAQRLSLQEGGAPLGFEVVCFAYNDFADSMYCNYTVEEMGTMFGIRPNSYGLIETREEAKRFNDWIAEDPSHRGEPLPYAYWLLVSYPLSSQ